MRRMLVIVLVLLLLAAPVWANGGQIQVPEQRVGPYLVTVFTSPSPFRAGQVDVSVLVRNPAGELIDDAQVTVTTVPLGHAGPGGTYPATQAQASIKSFYSAKFNLPEAGQWRMTVAIAGAQGSGSTTFDVDAGSASLISAPFLIALLLLVPLGIGWRLAQAQRRRLRQAASTEHEPS